MWRHQIRNPSQIQKTGLPVRKELYTWHQKGGGRNDKDRWGVCPATGFPPGIGVVDTMLDL